MDSKFLQIDEEGYFASNGIRVNDADYTFHLYESLQKDEGNRLLAENGTITVEAFDEALVARQVHHAARGQWEVEMPAGWREQFDPHTLTLDEWDRFHGHTKRGLPFVLSRPAQAEFFKLCDEFEDDSVTLDGEKIPTHPWLEQSDAVTAAKFWNEIYETEPQPGFDLQQPAPSLISILNRVKIPKSRIVVLGAGPCHDAAYLAQQGHLVTAVDFSREGTAKARAQYGEIAGLKIVEADIFKLPREMQQSFDVVFEHTCYCAVDPTRRNELLKVWRSLLVENGHLLGIFFAMDKRQGPPYGGSEWEVRERLKKSFQFLYWERVRNSTPKRLGKEFVVYAQKRRGVPF
jgi:SAM-dependent methyltransferase